VAPPPHNRGDPEGGRGRGEDPAEQQPFASVTLDIESRQPSANLEDKSAPVGANVVIIGGGNLSTREKRRRWQKRGSRRDAQ